MMRLNVVSVNDKGDNTSLVLFIREGLVLQILYVKPNTIHQGFIPGAA